MRDLNQPEAMDQAPPRDPWVAALGADRPRQAAPAFKTAQRERLVSGTPPSVQTARSVAGRRRNLSLVLVLGLSLWWLTRPEGERKPAPASRPMTAPATVAPTLPPALPTVMTLVTAAAPASQSQPPATAGIGSQSPRPIAPAPLGPTLAPPTPAPAAGADEAPEQEPRLLPTIEPSRTPAEPQLPPEPPTPTALPVIDFPTTTPTTEAPSGPPSAPLAP